MVIHTLFLIASLAIGVISGTPCKVSDAECITIKIQNTMLLSGDPPLRNVSFDPLYVQKFEANLPIIKYVFYNSTVLGYNNNCKINGASVAPGLNILHCILYCNEVSMSGEYEIRGGVAALQIHEKGYYRVTTGKFLLFVDAHLHTYVGSDRKNHLGIGDFELKSTALSANSLNFKKVNIKQELLSKAVQKSVPKRWENIAQLFQDSIWHGTMTKLLSNFNKYLQIEALEDILIP